MDQSVKAEFFNVFQEFAKKLVQTNTINSLKKYYTLAEVCHVFNITKTTFLTIVEKDARIKLKQVYPKHTPKSYHVYDIKTTNSVLIELGYPKLSKKQKGPVEPDAFFNS